MDPAKGAELPMGQSPVTKFARDAMATFPYRQLIGSLMHLMVAIRPNLAFSLSKRSKFNNSPGRAHWEAACKVFGYLRQTAEVDVLYRRKGPLQVQGVCDAAFACHVDDRKAQGGYVFLMGGAAVSLKSYTNSTVARLTPKSEYVAASDAGAEAIFLRNFLGELGFPQHSPTPIFTDSTGAQAIINNPCNQARTKHIEIHCHYVRQHVAAGRLDYRRAKSSRTAVTS